MSNRCLFDITECLHLSSNCSRLHSNRPKLIANLSQSFQNHLATSHNASNRLFSPQNPFKSIQNCPKTTSIVTNRQNFIQNFNKLLAIVLLGHQFITICPQIVSKHHTMSPIIADCPEIKPNWCKSPQNVPHSSKYCPSLTLWHHRMSHTSLSCPEINSNHHKMVSNRLKCPFNSLLRSHSTSLPSLMSPTLISNSPKLHRNFQNLSPLTL